MTTNKLMDNPNLVPVKRLHPGEPAVWDWQDEKGGSIMPVYETLFAAVLPKKSAGAIVRVYEEAEFRKAKRIVPSGIELFTDAGELLERLVTLRRAHNDTNRIFMRLTELEHDFFYFLNRQRGVYQRLSILPVPNATDAGEIGYHVNLVRELSRLHRENVYFPAGSEVPGILAAVPEMAEKPVTDLDYPAAAAVAYAIAACYLRPTREEATVKKRPYDPLGPDDPVMKYDPFAEGADRTANYDPFRG